MAVDWEKLTKLVRQKQATINTRRKLWYFELVKTGPYGDKREEIRPANERTATLIGAKAEDGLYYPVLDMDFPCHLYPSETEGHFHLFLDKGLTWKEYRDLLEVLANTGLLEKSFVKQGILHMDTYVATKPWKDNK